MRLGYTVVYVKDVAGPVAFYEKAFGLKRRFMHKRRQYAEMGTGATALAFTAEELAGAKLLGNFRRNHSDEPPAGFEISLQTSDVEAVYKRAVKAGAQPLSEPEEKPWGQKIAFVRDCNGVLVEIASPLTN